MTLALHTLFGSVFFGADTSDIVITQTQTDREQIFAQGEVLVQREGSDEFTRVRAESGESTEELVARLSQDKTVTAVEPNYIAYGQAIPNDMFYSLQWNFHDTSKGGINAPAAWEVTDGSGVVVAVLDTGVAYEDYNGFKKAPDLAGTKFARGYDFVNNDSHPNDDNGHGTHIAGTIAGTSNNVEGVAGLAPGVTIMPVKVLDADNEGTYENIAKGIRFAADNGADVINLSLGGYQDSSVLRSAVAYAHKKGVVLVASAGNDGLSRVQYPAAYDQYVIAVGATTIENKRGSYSNYGPSIDLVAPGGDLDVDRDGNGQVDGILQQTMNAFPQFFSYMMYRGTSMAAAHVSGSAALVIASGKADTPAQVRSVLQNNADDLGLAGKDTQYGHGKVNLGRIFGQATAGQPQTTTTKTTQQSTPQTKQTNQTAPTFRSTPNTVASVGTWYQYKADANDGNTGDYVRYKLTKNPQGMYLNSITGLVKWSPSNSQSGSHVVVIEAYDNYGNTSRQEFTVTVSGGAQSVVTQTSQLASQTVSQPQTTTTSGVPVITSTPVTSVKQNTQYQYTVSAQDNDAQDWVRFTLIQAPQGMYLNSITGLVKWRPSVNQSGNHSVTIEAKDRYGNTDRQTFIVSVQ